MSDTGRKIQLFGTRGSADAYAIRDFLHRCDQSFDWIELNNDQSPCGRTSNRVERQATANLRFPNLGMGAASSQKR